MSRFRIIIACACYMTQEPLHRLTCVKREHGRSSLISSVMRLFISQGYRALRTEATRSVIGIAMTEHSRDANETRDANSPLFSSLLFFSSSFLLSLSLFPRILHCGIIFPECFLSPLLSSSLPFSSPLCYDIRVFNSDRLDCVAMMPDFYNRLPI